MCCRAKIFQPAQPGIEPGSLDLQANTIPCRCKSQLLLQSSRSVYISRIFQPFFSWGQGPVEFEITPMVSSLGWESLQDRRKIHRLNMLFKVKHNLVEIAESEFIIQSNHSRTQGSRTPMSQTHSAAP